MSEIVSKNYSLPWGLGFTLVELLFSITLLTLLLVLSMPSFKDMLMNNRVSTQADALTTSLNYARNTALNQNINVMACPLGAANSTTCGNNWENGWIIVTQPVTGAATLLQSNNTGTNGPILSSTVSNVVFDARGIATTQANFKFCDDRGGGYARSVVVLPTGFVHTASAMGIAAWDDSPLTCP